MTQVLGMSLADTLTPITKANFKKWHNEGVLLLLNAGNGVLDIVLSRLNNYSIEWRKEGKQTTTATVDGAHNKIYMFSNGCDEFIIVVDDASNSDYMAKKHLTIYVVND